MTNLDRIDPRLQTLEPVCGGVQQDRVGELAQRGRAAAGTMTMDGSQLAKAARIGRATLYKYFADVEQVFADMRVR